MTETGLSLGTPHYMSPEQATAEKEISARSDVYSLASVCYEMLAGQPPHLGGSAQQIIMKIIAEPAEPVTRYRKSVPRNVAAALTVALEKLPADRFGTAREFAEALANPAFTAQRLPGDVDRSERKSPWRDPRVLTSMTVGLAAGAALVALVAYSRDRVPVATEYDVGLPDSAGMYTPTQDVGFAVSPNGDFVVYETVQQGRSELWYRSLVDAAVRRIPGTDNGSQPVVSPDGSRVAFIRVAGSAWTVEVVPVAGGSATTIGRGVGIMRRLFWPAEGPILLLQSDEYVARWLDPERGPVRTVPIRYCESQSSPIPGGDSVLCGGGGQKWAYRIDLRDTTVEMKLWTASDSGSVVGSSFHVVDRQYLTYMSNRGDLLATSVDLKSGRVGRSVRMASGIGMGDFTGTGSYVISRSGTLVYAQGDNRAVGHLVHLRRDGIDTLPVGREAFRTFAHSPNGRRLAAVVEGLEGNELRIYDLASGRFQTWVRKQVITNPIWSPAGDRLLFGANDSLFLGSPDVAAPPQFLLYQPYFEALRWTPDDRVYGIRFRPNAAMVMQLGRGKPALDSLLSDVGFFWPSADGRWLAYTNGAYTEAWVEPLPRNGRRYQAAAGNLTDIQWLSNTELGVPVIDGTHIKVDWASVDPGSDPPVRNRGLWAAAPEFRDTDGPSFATAPGGGVVYLQGAVGRPAPYLRVVPDWVDRMKRAVDAANR
jgi:eukaryotic-like serine/threonine-protein kinase